MMYSSGLIAEMAAMSKTVYTVGELTRWIKYRLEQDERLQQVWVRAEISNFKHHSSGHMYFTLKDKTSRLRTVMFASHNQRIRFLPEDGMNVLVRGNVSVYERDGQYQFYALEMQPDGVGSLYLAFEQLKKKLEQEGLFSPTRKKSLPSFPKTIGVMTSPTGAAVQDILTTLRRRMPSVKIKLYAVPVQGRAAAPGIVAALREAARKRDIDLLILGRGGGSLEELWAFNEEAVARTVAQFPLPIISAVGHETDTTMIDFIADLRAATPTAAAEMAIPHHLELKQRLQQQQTRLLNAVVRHLERRKEKWMQIQSTISMRKPKRWLQDPAQRLDRLKENLYRNTSATLQHQRHRWLHMKKALSYVQPERQIAAAHDRLQIKNRDLNRLILHHLEQRRSELQNRMKHLDHLSPLKIMQRGYHLTYNEDKSKLITSVQQVKAGDLINMQLADGELDCRVISGGEG